MKYSGMIDTHMWIILWQKETLHSATLGWKYNKSDIWYLECLSHELHVLQRTGLEQFVQRLLFLDAAFRQVFSPRPCVWQDHYEIVWNFSRVLNKSKCSYSSCSWITWEEADSPHRTIYNTAHHLQVNVFYVHGFLSLVSRKWASIEYCMLLMLGSNPEHVLPCRKQITAVVTTFFNAKTIVTWAERALCFSVHFKCMDKPLLRSHLRVVFSPLQCQALPWWCLWHVLTGRYGDLAIDQGRPCLIWACVALRVWTFYTCLTYMCLHGHTCYPTKYYRPCVVLKMFQTT